LESIFGFEKEGKAKSEQYGSSLTAPRELGSSRHDNFASRPSLKADLELREIVRILWRRKIAIFSALFAGFVFAALSVLFAKNEYSSTATIEMNQESSSALGLADLSGSASGSGDQEQMNINLLTEETIILSDNTALRVIEDLKLDAGPPFAIPEFERRKESPLEPVGVPIDQAPHRRERALKIFKSGLHVSLIKGTRLIAITYTDSEPNRAAAVANAVVDAYMNESNQSRFQASSKTSFWLTGQLAALKQKAEESQSRITAFERGSGLTGITALSIGEKGEVGTSSPSAISGNAPLERLLELNRDLTSAEIARIAKEAIYKLTESQDPEVGVGIGSSALASAMEPDSAVAPGSAVLALLQQLRQQLAQVDVQLATSGTKYGAKSPVMIQLLTEREAIEAQIRSELERVRMRTENELNLAILAEDGIRRQIAAQEKIVDKVTEKSDQLVLLQEEAQSNREIYQDLYSKLEKASVTAGIKASNITLVEPARIPAQPSYPKKKTAIVSGALIGLVVGFAAAFSWDYFDDSIATPEQVEQITAIPVVGAIPDFDRRRSAACNFGWVRGLTLKSKRREEKKSNAWLIRAPRSQVAESYRAIRTALMQTRAEHPPRVILFMSGSPGEGKSTTCLNTAAAFALQGDRVLCLDADLRHAQAHRFFNCSNKVGLSNCLASGIAFPKTLKPYPGIRSLFILPAGPHPPNPSELLGSKRFSELLSELRTHFDYIFIDSPPALLVTDAQLISPLVDGVVLVVRSNKTSKQLLERCLSLMRAAKAPALGIVMNALNLRSAGYEGYGHFGRGSSYYVDEK
jgi:capsular exopolysaccharide synthesis family protein